MIQMKDLFSQKNNLKKIRMWSASILLSVIRVKTDLINFLIINICISPDEVLFSATKY